MVCLVSCSGTAGSHLRARVSTLNSPPSYTSAQYGEWLARKVHTLQGAVGSKDQGSRATWSESLLSEGSFNSPATDGNRQINNGMKNRQTLADLLRDGHAPPLDPASGRPDTQSEDIDALLWRSFHARVSVNNHTTKPELLDALRSILGELRTALQHFDNGGLFAQIAGIRNALSQCYPSEMKESLSHLYPSIEVAVARNGTRVRATDTNGTVLDAENETAASTPVLAHPRMGIGSRESSTAPLVAAERSSIEALSAKASAFLEQMQHLKLENEAQRPHVLPSTLELVNFCLSTAVHLLAQLQQASDDLEGFVNETHRSSNPYEQVRLFAHQYSHGCRFWRLVYLSCLIILQVFRMKLYLRAMFHVAVEEGDRLQTDGNTEQSPNIRALVRKRVFEKLIDVVQRLIASVQTCDSIQHESNWQRELQAVSQLLPFEFQNRSAPSNNSSNGPEVSQAVGLAGTSLLELAGTLLASNEEGRLRPLFSHASMRNTARSAMGEKPSAGEASDGAFDAHEVVLYLGERAPPSSSEAATKNTISISESSEEQRSNYSRRVDQAGWSERLDNRHTPRPGVANWVADKTAVVDATMDCIDAYNEFFESRVASSVKSMLAEMQRMSALFAVTNNSIVVNATRRIHQFQMVRARFDEITMILKTMPWRLVASSDICSCCVS